MTADAAALHVVVSWTCGFLVLVMIGVAIPVLASFLPDAVHAWRRRGEAHPTLILTGLVSGLVVLSGYEATFTGTAGTPTTTLWITLGLLFGAGVGVTAFCSTASRAFRRRSDHRRALQAATAPPSIATARPGAGGPAAVQRLNARGAELLACNWMRHLGASEAVATPEQRDGGVDVRSRDFIAQVKHIRNEQIGVTAVRQLYGVATAEQRRALFFSTSGYTRDALAFARENGIALFLVRYQEGRLVPHGTLAQHYLAHGLNPVPQH